MTNRSPALLFSIIMLVMLFLSTYVYAVDSTSLQQGYVASDKSAKEITRQQLEDSLLAYSFDHFFNRDYSDNTKGRNKFQPSISLKQQSDAMLLEFKMKF